MLDYGIHTRCTAFADLHCIASGELLEVAPKAKEAVDRLPHATILVFDDTTGEQIEVDFRGTADDVRNRLAATASESAPVESTLPDAPEHRGPGRPKLGVVAHEVTLLPRHWDWLSSQPGGASVALRKLVDQARRVNERADRVRLAQETTYRFMSGLGGNLPGFEEAIRALFAGDLARFRAMMAPWPEDVRNFTVKIAAPAFPDTAG